jgi:hypothetical protein
MNGAFALRNQQQESIKGHIYLFVLKAEHILQLCPQSVFRPIRRITSA